MAVPATASSFDVAYWFVERAMNEGEYLQPQKLHRVMYLAQAYFAVAYPRRLLMPALFVADELGPIEPNVFRVCSIQRPPLEDLPVSDIALQFLDSIWRRFGQHSSDYLNRMISTHDPFRDAREEGVGTEITLSSMIAFYGRKQGKTPVGPATGARAVPMTPEVGDVLGAKLMRNTTGKPVAVQRWVPRGQDPDAT